MVGVIHSMCIQHGKKQAGQLVCKKSPFRKYSMKDMILYKRAHIFIRNTYIVTIMKVISNVPDIWE